jgi:Ca2+-binding EF-hand superfamily protein
METSLLAAAAFAGLAAGPLFAQPAAAPTPPSTRAEMAQRIQERFALRDANHDGFLTTDELGESAAMAIGQLDADHDGKISLAEASTAMLAMFDRVDTNHDGTVSPDERAAAEAQMGQPQPQPAPEPQPAPQPN